MTGYVFAGQRVRIRAATATLGDSNQSTVPIQGRVAGGIDPHPQLPRALVNFTFRPPSPSTSPVLRQYEVETVAGSSCYVTHLDLPGQLATRFLTAHSAGSSKIC